MQRMADHDVSTHTLLSLLLTPFPPSLLLQTNHTQPPPPRLDCRALEVRKDMESTCIAHKKDAPRRDHMKTHGVKLPNRGHNSAPVIRSRAGLGGADRVDDHHVFASEQPAQREPPHPLPSHRGSLTCPQTSCSMWACRALEPRHTSHFRVIVSGSAAACPNCGK